MTRALAALTLLSCFSPQMSFAQQQCPAPASAVAEPSAPVWDSADSLNQPIQVRSSGAEVRLREGGHTLTGEVTIEQGERKLIAQDAHYDPATGRFTVKDGVEYTDPELEVRGSGAQMDAEGGARFESAEFHLKTRSARGTAKQIEVNREREVHLDEVSYTSCPPGKNDWILTATNIDIYQQQGAGLGRNVRLDFKGVPILYAPIISFPVGNQRKSGFLFPTFGNSSRSGVELGVPWYWNIAPSYDATFTPMWYTLRGARLDGEFRYLTDTSEGALNVNYLPDDRRYGESRNLVSLLNVTDFTDNFRMRLDGANVSDDDWFEDFGAGPEGTSILYLDRSAAWMYFSDQWRVTALAQDFQTIDETIPREVRPYTVLPQVSAYGEWDDLPFGLTAAVDTEAAYFTRSESVTGGRFDVSPSVRMPLRRPGFHVEPSARWRYTTYDLEDTDPLQDSTPSRSLPEYSLDIGLAFERYWGSRQQRLQTLEPRLMYVYVPYRDQSDLPLFDTTAADLNLVQLFRSNRYVGLDRVSDTNQLSVGITTRLFDSEDGRQFISATLGQAKYFEPTRTRLPGETVDDTGSSDLIGELDITAFQDWNVRLGVQWDQGETRSERGDALIQYSPAPDRVINLGYRFRRAGSFSGDAVEQIDASFAWPVAQQWSLYGRMVYSLEDDASIENFAGLEYRSCCWGLRLVARRYVSNREGETEDSILLQLELNGLSNVGEHADAFLERSIRGYSPRSSLP